MINIGHKIRAVRKQKDMTLIEMSRITAIAQATLSRVETNDMLGTVECHQKMANALGMSLSELYEGVDARTLKTHHHKKVVEPEVSHANERTHIELRTSKALKKKLLPLVYTIKGNTQAEEERADRSVEKFLYVVDGNITVLLNKKEFPLEPDESLYFDGSLPHTFINKHAKAAKLVSVISPPA